MKTAIKFTAITLITVLAALACSNPVSLTDRDYRERNESNSAGYTNSPDKSYLPTIPSNLTCFSSQAEVAEVDKEATIIFPNSADVLKADNSGIEARLKEFLTFSQYTNPATNPAPAVAYTPSTLITPEVNYSFVRREGSNIIIRVDVPDIDYIVAKVDSSKYRVFGHSLDVNGDGIGGDIYDDYYTRISITGSTKKITDGGAAWSDEFFGPVFTFSIRISGPSGGNFTSSPAASQLFIIFNSNYSGENNAIRQILSDIVPKIEIQKYDQTNNTWAKDGNVELYDSTTTAPTDSEFTTDLIYGGFTPVDLGIYRVMATGLANLTTKENFGATDKPAKIRINESFLVNTIYTNPVSYYNSDRQWETANPIQAVVVRSDSYKKNVVLDVFFKPVYDLKTASDVLLEQMATEEFNRTFKLVYQRQNPGSTLSNGNIFNNLKSGDIVELKVNKVEYSVSKYFDVNNTKTNCITVTLDPSYRIDGNRAITLLLSPDFKYEGGSVTFGSGSTTNSYYNGAYFWRSYGEVPAFASVTGGSPGTPEVPGHWYDLTNGEDTEDTDPDSEKKDDPDNYEWIDTVPAIPAVPPSVITTQLKL